VFIFFSFHFFFFLPRNPPHPSHSITARPQCPAQISPMAQEQQQRSSCLCRGREGRRRGCVSSARWRREGGEDECGVLQVSRRRRRRRAKRGGDGGGGATAKRECLLRVRRRARETWKHRRQGNSRRSMDGGEYYERSENQCLSSEASIGLLLSGASISSSSAP
jgi:hypothetical protein